MPELPEVEAMRLRIANEFASRVAVRFWFTARDKSNFSLMNTNALRGARLEEVARHGKLIILNFGRIGRLAISCGMSGRLVSRIPNLKHDRFAIEFQGGSSIVFNDFRRFGRWHWLSGDSQELPSPLGPDALTVNFAEQCLDRGSSRSIKSILLDQEIVAGLGNIYAAEALFHARILPTRPVSSLTRAERVRIVKSVKSVLSAAVARGGSTLDDYRGTEGEAGDYDRLFAVYGREGHPCPGCDCDTGVSRIRDAGRSTYFCTRKQV